MRKAKHLPVYCINAYGFTRHEYIPSGASLQLVPLLLMAPIWRNKNSNVKNRQFCQQHNKPVELWSREIIEQKLNYIHKNPVEAGFVVDPHHWKYSSAVNFAGESGMIKIDFI